MESRGGQVFDIQGFPLYVNTSFLLSDLIAGIAVPMFYIISGYLFFLNVSSFSVGDYVAKLKNRVRSLLIPYVFWNAITLLLFFIMETFTPSLSSGANKAVSSYGLIDFFRVFWDIKDGLPLCGQFWFVRDLIMVVLFSPVIYFLTKKMGVIFIAILGLAWVSGFQGITGFSSKAVFFFSFGAWVSINRFDPFNISSGFRRWNSFILPLLLLLNIVLLNMGENVPIPDSANVLIHNSTLVCMICFCFYSVDALLLKGGLKINTFLHDSNFFIFAYHGLPLVFLIKMYSIILHPTTDVSAMFMYLICPLITILVGLLVYRVLMRLVPKFTAVITGGRLS